MSRKKHVDQLLVQHVEQLGEVVCLIAMSEKVDTEKLFAKVCRMTKCEGIVGKCGKYYVMTVGLPVTATLQS